jgi:two-component system sensor histidine kinase BaeS/two-component system sensor histidine kinase AdeS
MALAMVGAICLAVLFGYIGLTLWGAWATPRYTEKLSPPAQRAIAALDVDQSPSPQDMVVLITESSRFNAMIEREQDMALVVLTLCASLIGVLGGLLLAQRLAHPLENLADAARAVAAGDLSARARPSSSGAGETARLLEDFNHMADALERSDRQLKESSAAIAHELRTPLTVLRGRLQGMRDGVFGSGDREIEALIRQVDGLTRIVEDLRTVSNAEAGQLSLRCALVDLAEEADDVLRTVRPDFTRAGLALELDLRPTPIRLDAERARQVLLALVLNARLHAGEGGVIRVETQGDDDGAVLRVLDRGPGFPAGLETTAFQPFWRADASRSRDSGGTGLGLAVVAAVMKAHGGSARLLPRPGGGTIVELRFPRGA